MRAHARCNRLDHHGPHFRWLRHDCPPGATPERAHRRTSLIMTSSSEEEPTEHSLALPDALLSTTYELLRQYESGSFDEFALAEGVVKLLRFAVLQSTDARGAVIELCELINKRVEEKCVMEALAATTLDIVAVGDSDDFGSVQHRIDNLVSQVCCLEGALLESVASCLTADGDQCEAMVLAERDEGIIERGIFQALAEGIRVDVTIVAACEEMRSGAEAMQKRLANEGVKSEIVYDADVETAIAQCDVAIVQAVGVQAEDEALCKHGSGLISTAASLRGIPLMLLAGTHIITAEGSKAMDFMSKTVRQPGATWKYEQSREDRGRQAIAIVAPAYDRIALQKVHTILTERGCFATEFVKALAPRAGRVNES
eukprot:TRINITY_DN487_c0_g1_i1.p1 TRINITY_DN487_c0_g1~~TRINITY_DN487_c0_g1_i1.p1  ORF type:complete len:371 (+),score=68.67 TRINITY_DN487_c0_g1_i1:97-1209(+)